MPFEPGAHVHVAMIGKGVVREARNGGRYLVDVKGAAMVVAEAQLSAVEDTKRRPRRVEPSVAPAVVEPRARAASSIDLHGRTVAEAEEAVDEFLNAAMLAGLGEVRIIHGRSGGRVKAAVHARLKQLPSVRAFRVDPRNAGVTIVGL